MGQRHGKKKKKKEEESMEDDLSNAPANYKLLIIGDAAVGKTSLLKRFIEHTFSTDHEVTLGVDFKTHKVEFNGVTVNLSMWDTAGQERFKEFTTAYYNTADGIIIVYDVTNEETFENVPSWLETIESHTDSQNIKRVLVGNKCDLKNKRAVTTERGEEYANGVGLEFVESSAKEGENVNSVFNKLIELLSKDKG
eukprot:CAMPEP_0174261962 /NCGR_PEP_ID=MMETSP0439-20130205/12692_1 /TAXON_ID=0 /ORGANISM="Stereomyxa ramosa, Strain Chinc5" /LENGTH=194 /DNA_ID=CAMNT_0015346583 /DNA_START=95 /DNA_END=679 /DNA_ORIENTATION=-